MRLVPWVAAAAAVIAVVVWIGLVGLREAGQDAATADDVEETTRLLQAGDFSASDDPWYYDHPVLTGLGVGLVVLVLGGVLVLAGGSERRGPPRPPR